MCNDLRSGTGLADDRRGAGCHTHEEERTFHAQKGPSSPRITGDEQVYVAGPNLNSMGSDQRK